MGEIVAVAGEGGGLGTLSPLHGLVLVQPQLLWICALLSAVVLSWPETPFPPVFLNFWLLRSSCPVSPDGPEPWDGKG